MSRPVRRSSIAHRLPSFVSPRTVAPAPEGVVVAILPPSSCRSCAALLRSELGASRSPIWRLATTRWFTPLHRCVKRRPLFEADPSSLRNALPRVRRLDELGCLRLTAVRRGASRLRTLFGPNFSARVGAGRQQPRSFRPMYATHDSGFKDGYPLSRYTSRRSHTLRWLPESRREAASASSSSSADVVFPPLGSSVPLTLRRHAGLRQNIR